MATRSLEDVMDFKAACVSALMVLAGPSVAAAGPVVDAAERAEALQAEGKTVEALDALDEAVEAIWTASPLVFRSVELVEPAGQDGGFAERADRTFQADDRLTVRVEPVGYGYGGSGSNVEIGFRGDLALENATGQILTETNDLFSISVERPDRTREFDMRLSFVVPYVRPGDYIARFTIRDENSDKSGSFDVPFTVAAPGAATEAPAAGSGAAPAGGSETNRPENNAPDAQPAAPDQPAAPAGASGGTTQQ
jgi:hypothetical protein